MKHLPPFSLSTCLLLVAAPSLFAQPAGYPTRQGIIDQMNAAAAAFPAICQMVDLNAKYGTPLTWQGRRLYAVKISDNVAAEEDEQTIMVVSAHHANEIGTPVVALDIITRLTTGYGVDPGITSMVDDNEIWVAPLWNMDGYPSSRHNARPGGGVDLNRNYPFNWSSPCNSGVKGPSPASEPETQTMLAWSADQRFTKVLDFHSSGRETLYAYYQTCPNHRLLNYLRAEAVAISTASSYLGAVRGPSSNGEHYQTQLGYYSNYAFLTEISSSQSPSYTSAVQEATRLWPGTMFLIQRPVPVWGHVRDSVSGAPLAAQVSYVENPFTQGEKNPCEPNFGRYHAFLPNGNHTLRFRHPCYVTQDVPVAVTGAGIQVEVALVRQSAVATVRNGSGINPLCLSATNLPVSGQVWNLEVDASGVANASVVGLLSTQLPATGPTLAFGELLLDFSSPLVFNLVQAPSGNPVTFALPIPAGAGVLGYTASLQAVVASATTAALCNAIDYRLGCQ